MSNVVTGRFRPICPPPRRPWRGMQPVPVSGWKVVDVGAVWLPLKYQREARVQRETEAAERQRRRHMYRAGLLDHCQR